jgi:CxxC motif-containing protein
MLFLIALSIISIAFAVPTAAHAQPGYGARVTCSSNNGKRNWCDIGNSRDVQLVRQISGSPCVRGSTWGLDQRGLWVDNGCRAEFAIGRQPGPPPSQVINCSSNNGKRNWCAIGNSRDVQLVRQISGSPCVRGDTWGIDNRGLWVDRGCRADFAFGRGPGPPPPPQQQLVTCSSNNGKRNWCAIGNSRDVQLVRQISGSPCVRGDTWGLDQRGLWVDRGCRADFRVR